MIQREDLKMGACFIEILPYEKRILQVYCVDSVGVVLRGFNSEGRRGRTGYRYDDSLFKDVLKSLTLIDPKVYDKLKKLNDIYVSSVSSIFNEFNKIN